MNVEEKTAFTEAIAKWLQIMDFIHCSHTESMNCQCNVPEFSNLVINFIRILRTISPTPDTVVTPYLHALLSHVPTMLKNHRSLRRYSTSAQELKNSTQTIVQFRGSNQKNIPYDLNVHQLMTLYFSTKSEALNTPIAGRTNQKKFEFAI